MFDFTDEQKMVRKMVRQWAEKELAPRLAPMEKGEITPYETMRHLIKTFGMDEMVRTAFAAMKKRRMPIASRRSSTLKPPSPARRKARKRSGMS